MHQIWCHWHNILIYKDYCVGNRHNYAALTLVLRQLLPIKSKNSNFKEEKEDLAVHLYLADPKYNLADNALFRAKPLCHFYTYGYFSF